MKSIIKKSILFGLVGVVLWVIASEFILTSDAVGGLLDNHDWRKIVQRVEASKQKIKSDTLIVGCSVAGQFFPFNWKNQLTTNGSVLPIGNYFLVKSALEANPSLKAVVYASVPPVLGQRMTRERTHQYLVKPFFNLDNLNDFSESSSTIQILERNKLLYLNLFNSWKFLPLDDFNYSDPSRRYSGLSPESIEWLVKMKELCNSKGVEFILSSPPVSKALKEETDQFATIRQQVKGTALEDLFQHYFANILYLDSEQLKDQIHWNARTVKKYREMAKAKILRQQ